MSIYRWISEEPMSGYSMMRLWVLAFVLVFIVWAILPIALNAALPWRYISVSLTPRNLAKILSISTGEEFVFRVLPILIVLTVFPKRVFVAFTLGAVAAYFFGMWHDHVQTQKICLSIGGVILVLVYLKFGGASGKPFKGFMACASIHSASNIIASSLPSLFLT